MTAHARWPRRTTEEREMIDLMRVRAWRAQPDAWSRRWWRRWLLVVGDAVLAVALAVAFFLATGRHYGDRLAGVALILLQTLPLAVRRRYPLWLLCWSGQPGWTGSGVGVKNQVTTSVRRD